MSTPEAAAAVRAQIAEQIGGCVDVANPPPLTPTQIETLRAIFNPAGRPVGAAPPAHARSA